MFKSELTVVIDNIGAMDSLKTHPVGNSVQSPVTDGGDGVVADNVGTTVGFSVDTAPGF